MWRIGNVEIKNQIVLAPMAGISNPAYMKITEEMGVGLVYTELISAEAIVRNNKKTLEMLNGIDTLNIPVAVQLFGSNSQTIACAAKRITELYQVQIIDINMGCPVPKVALKSNSGSALLKDIKKIKEIVKQVTQTISIPVTVKIRSGWDNDHINAVEVAKAVEEVGASGIAIHARTRSQGYSGNANWEIIKEVKQSVVIPVIGNGDVKSCYDAKKMLEETKCDAVMIGRALLGNPWLIRDCVNYIDHKQEPILVSNIEKFKMILYHLDQLSKLKNEKIAVLEMRNHASWYLKKIPNTNELKKKLFKAQTILEFKKLIQNVCEENNYEC